MSAVSKRIGAIVGKKRVGKAITFRRVTSTGGASPATNPVTGNITVSANAAIGATAVTLNAPVGNWFLEAGDTLTIGTNTVTVSARTVAASGKFTAVPLSTGLTAAITAGQAVSVAWLNDYTVKAMVAGYKSSLIDGTVITVKDLRCLMQPTATDGRAIPTPGPLDKLGIDGAFRSVGVVNAQYAGSAVALWDVQAKG